MQQAQDFLHESEAIYQMLSQASALSFDAPTAFKGWTTKDILQHLHFWNRMAHLQISDEHLLLQTFEQLADFPDGMRAFEQHQLKDLTEVALLDSWRSTYQAVAQLFADCDPKKRLKWPGPDMSARSSITARLMETWAHSQAIYDMLGIVRTNTDRIRNIVVLGLNTYGWTFMVRQETPPQPVPFLKLAAPSGATWTFGETRQDECIEGLAEEFCQVITQSRNIADTQLKVTGPNATNWMRKAQCFAGPPETPPEPGERAIIRDTIRDINAAS
ncbi:MAG: TIGR03084 family metal-binding protein [Gammaproteobacteria bacterium]